jgi:hypothetical protein
LEHVANYDQLVREIMGVESTKFLAEKFEFSYQSILDNVSLVDSEMLQRINHIVVEAGHRLLKKKEEGLILKTDSYVLETNIHFPTDLNLLWDSCRKCLDVVKAVSKEVKVKGWRKQKHIRKSIKSSYRACAHQIYRGKDLKQKKESVKAYLKVAKELWGKCEALRQFITTNTASIELYLLGEELKLYNNYTEKFIDLIRRRLIYNEVIPAQEKIYSIFEPHTEWISKGKINKRVELGHPLLITTDQFHFIVNYKVLIGQRDPSQVQDQVTTIKAKFPKDRIESMSFDKAFYSKENMECLKQSDITQIILPKKGKKNKAEEQIENTKQFRQLRNAHSAIESNIHMLECHGLNRCPDKGLKAFVRYAGFGILAYNLHILGKQLMLLDRKKADRKKTA